MSHQFDNWYNTPNERLSVGRADGRTMEYTFFGVWKSVGVGSTPPQTATAAIAFAEASPNLANLRVDGEFVPPTSTSTPSTITAPPAGYILASMTVERLPETNKQTDIVWLYRCRLEYADLVSTDEPFVEVTQKAALQSVSAFRVNPTVATDDWTGLPENNTQWHSIQDIGGYKVDWNSQPIKFALQTHEMQISIYRPAPIWLANGTRSVGAIGVLSMDSIYIGYRNDGALGWMGDDGEVMLTGVNCNPFQNGLYQLTYQFRWHPWKHAIQSPYMVGATYDKAQNPDNSLRLQNNKIFWNQPHLAGADFQSVLQISTEEWDAVGI